MGHNVLKRAVIMAGGEGVRLRPLTYVIPKPLLPLEQYTVMEYLIKSLAENNIREIHVLASYQYEKFKVCLDYQERYKVNIRLDREEEQMGTIGGIINLRDELTGPLLLINADLVLKGDFQDMFRHHQKEKAVLTIGVKDYLSVIPYGVVSTDAKGNFSSFREKPSQSYKISIGANILTPEVLDFLDGRRVDFPEVVEALSRAGRKITTYEFEGLWIDVGRFTDYQRALEVLSEVENENQ